MQKLVVAFVFLFLVFGITLHAPLVISEEGSNSGNDSVSNNSGSSGDEDEDETEDEEDEEAEEDDNELKTRERIREEIKEGTCVIKIEKKIAIKEGKRVIEVEKKIECADGRKAEIKIKIENRTADGRLRERIKYEIEGEEVDVEAEEGIDLEEESNATHYKLKARLKNGNVTDIKVMPDRASEIALERLRALNFTIELREIEQENIPRVIYHIESNKTGRFLGIFKLSLKVEGQVDPETGEFLGISKPWWAFLVSGEDSPNEELIEGETEIKAETFNGTSEVKVELEFATDATDQGQIVDEILSRLNELNVSGLLEVEESDETPETEEKLEAEAEIEEGFAEVEFELRFIVNSDNAEDIVGAVTEKLSALTVEDINSVFSLEIEEEDEDEDEEEEENETVSNETNESL